MNIFVSDLDPIVAARNLDDKRVIKMALESAQILSTIGHGTYKPTHINHPCTKWAAASPSNALWLFRHFNALLVEYYHRFGKLHASRHAVPAYMAEVPFPSTFVVCPGGDIRADPTLWYQKILTEKWDHDLRAPKWTKRGPPSWYLRLKPLSMTLPPGIE